MTIAEHLEFSIVTAPLAQVDRRSLSQAWYSALYGAGGSAAEPSQTVRPRSIPSNAPNRLTQHQRAPGRAPVRVSEPRVARDPAAQTAAHGPSAERRSARSPLARRIERRFLHPAAKPSAASFSLEGASGRVQVLLKGDGPNVQLVAICAPAARAQVCAALAQARYALAARGLSLDARTRTVGS